MRHAFPAESPPAGAALRARYLLHNPETVREIAAKAIEFARVLFLIEGDRSTRVR